MWPRLASSGWVEEEEEEDSGHAVDDGGAVSQVEATDEVEDAEGQAVVTEASRRPLPLLCGSVMRSLATVAWVRLKSGEAVLGFYSSSAAASPAASAPSSPSSPPNTGHRRRRRRLAGGKRGHHSSSHAGDEAGHHNSEEPWSVELRSPSDGSLTLTLERAANSSSSGTLTLRAEQQVGRQAGLHHHHH